MFGKFEKSLFIGAALVLTFALMSMVSGNVTSVKAACPALTGTYGSVSSTVTVPADGTYTIWSRIQAPDATNNSLFLEVDGNTCGVVVGDSEIPANTWTWVNYRDGNTSGILTVSLTAGTHTLAFFGRETGVKLDKMLFLADQTCVPSETGENCTQIPSVTQEEPSPSISPSPSITSPSTTITEPTPSITYGVIAPCPTCSNPTEPQASPTISGQPETSPSESPSPSLDPCQPEEDMAAAAGDRNRHHKHHKHHKNNGMFNQIIQFLLELIMKLLEQIGIEVPTPQPTPTTSEAPSPSISTEPSTDVSPTVSTNPCPTITVSPSPEISEEPTVSLSPSLSETPSESPVPSVTISQIPSTNPSITASISPIETVTPTATLTPTLTPTVTPTVTVTPTISTTPSVSLTITTTVSPSPSVVITQPEPTVTQTPPQNNQLLQFIMQFIQIILEFFSHLFGRR